MKKVFLEVTACNFIKKETLAQVFSCEFCEISYNTFFTEHVWATASVTLSESKLVTMVWTMIQSHDQEKSKLNNTINANSGAHTFTHYKIIKSLFNKSNVPSNY